MKNYNDNINNDLEQVFQQLSTIQSVETSSDLYASIINKIQKKDVISDTISLSWLRAIAAILILFFSFEIIVVGKKYYSNTSTNLESLVGTNPNTLYNE